MFWHHERSHGRVQGLGLWAGALQGMVRAWMLNTHPVVGPACPLWLSSTGFWDEIRAMAEGLGWTDPALHKVAAAL